MPLSKNYQRLLLCGVNAPVKVAQAREKLPTHIQTAWACIWREMHGTQASGRPFVTQVQSCLHLPYHVKANRTLKVFGEIVGAVNRLVSKQPKLVFCFVKVKTESEYT